MCRQPNSKRGTMSRSQWPDSINPPSEKPGTVHILFVSRQSHKSLWGEPSPANFLLSGPRGPARGHRRRLRGQSRGKTLESQGSRLVLVALSALPHASPQGATQPCGRARPTPGPGLAGTTGKRRSVNLIPGGTARPAIAASHMRPMPVASSPEDRVDLSERGPLTRGRPWRVLGAVGRRSRDSPRPAAVNAGRPCGEGTRQPPESESVEHRASGGARLRLAAATRGSCGPGGVTSPENLTAEIQTN